MMIRNFVSQLKDQLHDLPGARAQQLMMPKEGSVERFNLNKNNVRKGGVLILFYAKNNTIHIPLTERHVYDGTHSGQVSLPGGKVEDVDESIIHTALRETNEEIGIPQSKIEILGTLTDLYIPPSNFRVTPVLGFTEESPKFLLDPREVKELIEAPVSHLLDPKHRKWKQLTVRNYRLNTPYFDIQEKVVWGATAMILSELAEIVRGIKIN